MLNETTIEKRLVNLEQAVGELQEKFEAVATSPDWLDKLTGSISDEEAFIEALEYGRAFRQADRPIDECDELP